MTCTTTNYRVYKHRPLPPLRVAVVAAVAVAVAVALLWREDSNNGAVVTTVLAFAPAVSNFKKRHYNNYDYRYSSYGSTSTRTRTTPPTKPTLCLRVGSDQSSSSNSNGSNSNSNNRNNDEEDDEDKMISDFFFNVSRCKLNSMRSMDPGIQEMISGGEGSGVAPFEDYNYYQHQPHHHQQQLQQQQTVAAAAANHRGTGPATVVVVDWECLLDALPYHVELGIHAARTVWPHLNDLCNFDTDRKWLENKLYAMSHVLGYPDGPDRKKHVACEYALATRLILEEQALDRNESTGTNGKYSRRFHPRSEINGSDKFREEARSRRPLTAGELAVNWREFIRSTLLVKYSRTTTTTSASASATTTTTTTTTTREPDPELGTEHDHEQQQQQQRTVIEPTRELERAIEDYLRHSLSSSRSSSRSTGRIVAPRSLPLFAKTKFALRNTSTKLVIRISHRFDHDVAARNINRQLQLAPQERIAKTYKAENAIRRLFLNEDKNMVLLLQPEFDNPKYEYSCSIDDDDATSSSGSGECSGSGGGECIEQGSGRNSNSNGKNQASRPTAEESCLRNILRFTHECNERIQSRNNNNNNEAHDEEENDRSAPPSSLSSSSSSSPPPSTTTTTTTMPSVVWIDSSWHRLQPLAPIFGDAIPGPNNTNGKKNTALCELPYCDDRERDTNNSNSNSNNKPSKATASVWLSLYLAEWPAIDSAAYGSEKTKTISTSENHQAAMVYPWTDCLSWDDAEDILLPNDWGLSDTAFQ
eukprot:jgi/Psemu1/19348/gm1.19348_g